MSRPNAMEFQERMQAGRWFSSLPPALQEALLGVARARVLVDGERLFSRGDACDGIHAVVEGSIRVSGTSESGKEALLVVLEAPNWFGEVAVFDGQARTHDACADGPTTLLHVPLAALESILEEQPQYWQDLGRLVAGKLRLAFATMEDTALLPMSLRIARRLAMMAGGYGQWEGRSLRMLEVSQDQLALMLATSRQTANQHLKALEANGLIRIAYGQIEILDLDGLREAGMLEALD